MVDVSDALTIPYIPQMDALPRNAHRRRAQRADALPARVAHAAVDDAPRALCPQPPAVALAGTPVIGIVLCFEGFSYTEMGQVLGISTNAAMLRCQRAKTALKSIMEKRS